MPDLEARITKIVAGDALEVRRTIDRAGSGFAAGVVITDAWFTCKNALADADVDALFQKAITTTDLLGTGQIEDDGAGDVDFVVRFDLLPADTTVIGTLLRHYDIQVKTAGLKPYTPELGRIDCRDGVTDAT